MKIKNWKLNNLLKIVFPWKKLSKTNQRILMGTVLTVIIILTPLAIYSLTHLQKSEAAWFNDSWGYRQNVAITNSGSAQTNYQVAITLDTASLITNGKMQSNCNDIRITDINGKLLPFWIETGTTGGGGKACNASTTQIWTKVPSIPTSGQTIYLYYGNPQAQNTQNGNKVFELFDDFSGPAIDSSKWTQGTVASATGTTFSESGGTLNGGDNNRYIQSANSFSGDYIAETRINTASPATNGFSTVGFYASSSNSFGILDHNGTSYYRNDSSWVNFTYNGSGQWNRDKVKIVGTNATYWRTGETSGSATATGITNSGISNEYLRLGSRYDDGAFDQNYSATWDFVFIRKTAATEPTVGSPTGEEVGAAPVLYLKFDEGTGTSAKDSSSNGLNGTITSATWQKEDQCISGKCLFFNGSTSVVDSGTSSMLDFPNGNNYTIEAWINPKNVTNLQGIIGKGPNSGSGWGIQINTTSKINCGYHGNGNFDGNTVLQTNKWYHVACVTSGGTQTIYVNGLADGSSGSGAPTTASAYPFQIGAVNNLYYFNGFIDDVRVYRYARTASQIKVDYNSRGSRIAGGNVLGASSINKNISNGLVGYWKMDESSWNGTTGEVVDSSGNANNGTEANGANTTTGKFGNGGTFNGSNDYVSVPNSSNLQITGSITISAWIKANSVSGRQVLLEKYGSYGIKLESGQLVGYRWGGSENHASSTLSTGTWYFVTMTFDDLTHKTYVNGTLVNSESDSGSIPSTTNVVGIGASATSGNYFNGLIDEARVYNRALSTSEVQQLYNFAPGPVAYWNFEEGSGTTVNDTSGNGLTASVNSGTSVISGKYGKARQFTQDTDKISTSTTSVLNTDLHTISFWINLQATDGNWRQIMAYRSGTDRSPGIWVNPSNLCIHWRYDPGNTGVSCGGPTGESSYLTQNTWYYLTGVKNGNTFTFYVNGVQAEQVTVANPKTSGTAAIEIGQTGFSAAHMKIDEVKIYNYALSSKQIVSDMNAGHPNVGSPVGSPLGYWKFDEGYGITANNSGNGGSVLNGTLTGATSLPTWTTSGKFGKAINFDGTDDYVSTSMTAAQSAMSITTWVKTSDITYSRDGSGWQIIASKWASGNKSFVFYIANGVLAVQISPGADDNGTTNTSTFTLSNNIWAHVGFTYDDSIDKVVIYKDGQSQSFTNTQAMGGTTGMQIGRLTWGNSTDRNWKGQIDEVKMYNYALTADEVKLDYNHGASMVLGSMSDTSGLTSGSVASNSASAAYCVPGDTSTCNSPIGEWNFEEGQGSTVNDTSGNGNLGTWYGTGNHWAQGKMGKAGKFNGSDDYITTGNTNFNVNKGTFSAWVNPAFRSASPPTTYNVIFQMGTPTSGIQLSYSTANGFYSYINSGFRASTGTVSFAANTWHYLTIDWDFDANTYNLYFDGVKYSNTSTLTAPSLQTIYLAKSAGNYFTGLLDGVKIYNYVRTPAQVAWDYNRGAPVGYWKMDECQGTTAHDSSSNGNNGTITIGGTGAQTSAGTCTTAGTAWGNGVTGKYNSSLNFDGTDDFVSATDNNALKGGLTISTWYKASSTVTYNTMFNRGGQGDANGFVWFFFDNSTKDRLWYQEGNASYCSLKSNAGTWGADGQWHNLVASHNPTTNYITFYKDGNVIGGGSCTWANITNSSEYIGTYNGSSSNTYTITGQLDDFRLYNYALTKQQIQQVYNQGAGVRFGPQTGTP